MFKKPLMSIATLAFILTPFVLQCAGDKERNSVLYSDKDWDADKLTDQGLIGMISQEKMSHEEVIFWVLESFKRRQSNNYGVDPLNSSEIENFKTLSPSQKSQKTDRMIQDFIASVDSKGKQSINLSIISEQIDEKSFSSFLKEKNLDDHIALAPYSAQDQFVGPIDSKLLSDVESGKISAIYFMEVFPENQVGAMTIREKWENLPSEKQRLVILGSVVGIAGITVIGIKHKPILAWVSKVTGRTKRLQTIQAKNMYDQISARLRSDPTQKATLELLDEAMQLIDNIPDKLKMLHSFTQAKLPNMKSKIVNDFLAKEKVYLTMTTSPTRLKFLPAVLAPLDLTYVDEILITLPKRYGPKGELYGDVPKSILNHPKIKIIRPDEDVGPATKILGAIDHLNAQGIRGQGKNPIIVSIDDDVAYQQGLVTNLIHSSIHHKNHTFTMWQATFGWYGLDTGKWPNFHTPKDRLADHLMQGEISQGVGGIAYRLEHFDNNASERIKQITRDDRKCFASDDLVIGFVLALAGYSAATFKGAPNNEFGKVDPFEYGMRSDALFKGKGVEELKGDINANKYKHCLDYLHSLGL